MREIDLAQPYSRCPLLIQGDATHLPFADESVDLIVTSPPYWSLRSYSDGGKHYAHQIGSEPTLSEYLDNLIVCTREMVRVIKPSGSIWVNIGDKYSGGSLKGKKLRDKSLLLLPHRYAIRCADELGLIVRQDQVWAKANPLPESVTDRTRREHEYIFHFVRQPHYYSAVDEIRGRFAEHQRKGTLTWKQRRDRVDKAARYSDQNGHGGTAGMSSNLLGKLPGSIWSISSQPLRVPMHISHARCCDGVKRPECKDGLGHYAAFPFALVRPIILGWSPKKVCVGCGEGLRSLRGEVGIGGCVCACPDTFAASIPGVVVDPFGGTGSTAIVAAMNGRVGVSIDASWDYCNLIARWRMNDPKERTKAS